MTLTWRQELFAQSPQQLQALLPFLTKHRLVSACNIPNKFKAELPSLLERARLLSAALPPEGCASQQPSSSCRKEQAICVHYAINNNYCRTVEASYEALEDFAVSLAGVGGCSLLLVTGGGPRRRLDSLAALELAAASPRWPRHLPLSVAFNPYFPDQERQQEERQRLRLKLLAGRGLVTAIYLQAGCDAQRLEEGLEFLRQLLEELGKPAAEQAAAPAQQAGQARAAVIQGPPAKWQRLGSLAAPPQRQAAPCMQEENGGDAAQVLRQQQAAAARPGPQQGVWPAAAASGGQSAAGGGRCRWPMAVHASVLMPSKRLLAQMKFRCWGGVFLSEQYLSSVEAADELTRCIVQACARQGVTPLLETEVASEAQLERARQLLAATTL